MPDLSELSTPTLLKATYHLARHLRDDGSSPPEDAIDALVDAGFTRESAVEALNLEALRKESSEPPVEGTPEATEEVADEQDPVADGEPADALLGAENPHSGRSRAIGTNDLPPWREDEPRTPPWRSQEG